MVGSASALRRAARSARRRGARRRPGVHHRRTARSAGVAQAGVGRSASTPIGSARARAAAPKGRDFSEPDKRTLREVELEILAARGSRVPRRPRERGQIELSTSPFYHPILPLLCDLGVYRDAPIRWPPPEEPFAYPADALEQLRRARRAAHAPLRRARRPGLWPSEGVGVGRHGGGRARKPGSRGWPPTRRSWGSRSASPSGATRTASYSMATRSTGRTRSAGNGHRRLRLPRSRAVGSRSASPTRRGPPRTRRDDFVRRIAAAGRDRAAPGARPSPRCS